MHSVICEGKRERRKVEEGMGVSEQHVRPSLPREIGLARQVAKVRAVTIFHALVPVTISTVCPVTA